MVDTSYVDEVRARHARLSSAGLRVVLDIGVQYPPAWVFDLPGGTRWADQHGQVHVGGPGADAPDAVWNGAVRAAQGRYVAEAARALQGRPLLGVRVGGGPYGELRFPEPAYGGRTDSWWAFGPAAMRSNPVPSWRPGQPDPVAADRFLDWYLGSLTEYLDWQLDTYRSAFGPEVQLQVLQPSWGIRAGEPQAAVADSLGGSSRGERRQTLQQGLDWAGQLPVVASHPGTVLSSTWLDAADQGTDPAYESPVRYLARLASPTRIAVMGENTGRGSPEDMRRSVGRVRELGLVGMLWMREPDLYGTSYADLGAYQRLIAGT